MMVCETAPRKLRKRVAYPRRFYHISVALLTHAGLHTQKKIEPEY